MGHLITTSHSNQKFKMFFPSPSSWDCQLFTAVEVSLKIAVNLLSTSVLGEGGYLACCSLITTLV